MCAFVVSLLAGTAAAHNEVDVFANGVGRLTTDYYGFHYVISYHCDDRMVTVDPNNAPLWCWGSGTYLNGNDAEGTHSLYDGFSSTIDQEIDVHLTCIRDLQYATWGGPLRVAMELVDAATGTSWGTQEPCGAYYVDPQVAEYSVVEGHWTSAIPDIDDVHVTELTVATEWDGTEWPIVPGPLLRDVFTWTQVLIKESVGIPTLEFDDNADEDYFETITKNASLYELIDPSGDDKVYVGGIHVPFTDNVTQVIGGIAVNRAPAEAIGPNAKRWSLESANGDPFAVDVDVDASGRIARVLSYAV